MGLVDGCEGRRGRRICCRRLAFHHVHRERRDDAVRQLVDDVERLEGCDRRHAAGLRLDDEDLLLAVHHLRDGRRAARRAMVRPVRVGAHADAAVLRGTSRERRVVARDWRLRRRVAAMARLDGRRAPTGWHAKKQRAHVSGTSSSHGHAMLFTTQQHWPWCLIHVDGHLQPSAQQHNPHWQQTSLSTNDSQHVSGGTPAFKQQRLTQQQSSPLHDAPQHLRRRRRGVRQTPRVVAPDPFEFGRGRETQESPRRARRCSKDNH